MGRRLLAALLALACAACVVVLPTTARAELASQEDWRENVRQREDEPDEVDWDATELGGVQKPMFSLSDPFRSVSYELYSWVESACGTLVDVSNDLFAKVSNISGMASYGYDGSLDGDADHEDETMARLYRLASRIQRDVVSKVALGFLGLSLGLSMLEHAKEMSQRGHEAMGTMASYLWLLAKYAIIMQLVNNVDLLCGAIFNVFGWVAKQTSAIAGAIGAGAGGQFDSFMIDLQKVTYAEYGQIFVYALLAVVMAVVVATTVVRVLVATVVRLIEVYVTAAFAGFPLIMLMGRETKDAGVRFFRGFAGLCLQTSVLVLLVACSGVVISAATSLFSWGGPGIAGAVLKSLGPIAGCLAVGSMVGQSRHLADRIMGAQ